MNIRESWKIIIKTILTVVGSFLIGKNILSVNIDESIWQIATGLVMSAGSIYWSIKDKCASWEVIGAFLRQLLGFLGGFLVARGWLTNENLVAILGLIAPIIAATQSYVSKKKAADVQSGKINVVDLKTLR